MLQVTRLLCNAGCCYSIFQFSYRTLQEGNVPFLALANVIVPCLPQLDYIFDAIDYAASARIPSPFNSF